MKRMSFWYCERCGALRPDNGEREDEVWCACEDEGGLNEPFTFVFVVIVLITVVYVTLHVVAALV